MNTRDLGRVSLLLAGLTLAACPRRTAPPPIAPGITATQLLQQVRKQGSQRRQAIGRIRLNYLGTDGVFQGEADVAVRRPFFLRLELRSFFGQNAAALTVDEQGFVFVDNGQRRALSGDSDDPALRQILPLGLKLTDIVALLLASLPPLESGTTHYVQPSQTAWLALRHETDTQRWLIEVDERDHGLRRVRREERNTQNWVEFRVDRAETQAKQPFSMSGQAQTKRMSGSLRWRWQEVEINGPSLDSSVWRLSIPAGYSRK